MDAWCAASTIRRSPMLSMYLKLNGIMAFILHSSSLKKSPFSATMVMPVFIWICFICISCITVSITISTTSLSCGGVFCLCSVVFMPRMLFMWDGVMSAATAAPTMMYSPSCSWRPDISTAMMSMVGYWMWLYICVVGLV